VALHTLFGWELYFAIAVLGIVADRGPHTASSVGGLDDFYTMLVMLLAVSSFPFSAVHAFGESHSLVEGFRS